MARNNIIKAIKNDNTFTFIIQTAGETDFWWWEVPHADWMHYFKGIMEEISKRNIETFINDEEFGFDCGFSCYGFESIADAIADRNAEMQATEDEPEDDGELYRIHFMDSYGCGAIDCHGTAEYNRCLQNLKDDPEVEDIWTESYDTEEGWQA